MEIPLVVGKNKCVIVSSGPYTCVNHMPEMLRTRPHREWHSCEPGEATTPCPTLGQDSVQQALDPALPPPFNANPHRPLHISHCPHPTPVPAPAMNERGLWNWGCCVMPGRNAQGPSLPLNLHGALELAWISISRAMQHHHCAPLAQVGIQPSKCMSQIASRAIAIPFLLLNFYIVSTQVWDSCC